MRTFLNSVVILLTISLSFAQSRQYKILEGNIGKYKVFMQLDEIKNQETEGTYLIGNYWYDSQEIPISISQEAAENPEILLMITWNEDENQQEFFSGKFDKGIYKGTWTKAGKSLPFEFKLATNEKFTQFTHFQTKRVVPIKSRNPQDTIAGKSSYDFFLPSDKKLQLEFMQKIDKDFSDFNSWSKMRLDEFEKEYKSEIVSSINEFSELPSYSYNYEFMENILPYFNSENYLVMVHENYQYTGGAHGMSGETYFTYDKRNKKWIELSDVLDLTQFQAINKLLDKAVRKTFNLPSGAQLNEIDNTPFIAEEITYSENFTLSKKGITFHYGLYELTPYSYGYFEQFVSYEDLKPYLKKEFK